jgi:hypothetical protein
MMKNYFLENIYEKNYYPFISTNCYYQNNSIENYFEEYMGTMEYYPFEDLLKEYIFYFFHAPIWGKIKMKENRDFLKQIFEIEKENFEIDLCDLLLIVERFELSIFNLQN